MRLDKGLMQLTGLLTALPGTCTAGEQGKSAGRWFSGNVIKFIFPAFHDHGFIDRRRAGISHTRSGLREGENQVARVDQAGQHPQPGAGGAQHSAARQDGHGNPGCSHGAGDMHRVAEAYQAGSLGPGGDYQVQCLVLEIQGPGRANGDPPRIDQPEQQFHRCTHAAIASRLKTDACPTANMTTDNASAVNFV